MVSNVNPDFITSAPVSKTGMKAQLGIIRDEITDLQEDITTIGTNFTQVGTGAATRTWLSKARETLSALDFTGADPSGVADSTTALQNLFNAAASQGKFALIPEGTWRVNNPLTLGEGAAGLEMLGRIIYYGTGTALTIGSNGNTSRVAFKEYRGIDIQRNTIDWSAESEIGLLARNLDNSTLDVRRISGFCIGLRTLGAALNSGNAHGFEDNVIYLGQLVNNRYHIDVRTDGEFSWNNAVRYYGGHFANSSGTNTTTSRFGVRLSRADITSYDRHNHHVFYAPAFELQRIQNDGLNERDAIPFLLQVAGRGLHAVDVRMEACSPIVARHDAGYLDALYEIVYLGTYGANVSIDYTANSARAGGYVRVSHTMGAPEYLHRLVAEVESVRNAAYADEIIETNGKGFEKLAIMSTTAIGTTLTTMCRAAFDQFDLGTYDVGVTGGNALVFVVDCSQCKEFALAVGGEKLTPIIAQFDGAGNRLDGSYLVRMSTMGCAYNASANAWLGSVTLDATTPVTNAPAQKYFEYQRITLAPEAQFAAIGVIGEGTMPAPTGRIRAMRLYTPARAASPQILYGRQFAWGERIKTHTFNIDFPNVAAGANNAQSVTIPGLRGGDQCIVTPLSVTTLQFLASVGVANSLTVRFVNYTAGALDLGPTDFSVQVTKPRL